MTMKTLREYLDQLDEISRRDALKYAGAAAAGAALGKVPDVVSQQRLDDQPLSVKDFDKEDLDAIDQEVMSHLLGWDSTNTFKYIIFPRFGQEGINLVNNRIRVLSKKVFALSPKEYEALREKYGKMTPHPRMRAWVHMVRNKDADLKESEPLDPIAKIDRLFRDK